MKKIIATGLTIISVFVATSVSHAGDATGFQEMNTAKKVILALQEASSSNYTCLIPSRAEMFERMESDQSFGSSLNDAEKVFRDSYKQNLLPTVRRAFDNVLVEGQAKGINWEKIQFLHYEYLPSQDQTSTGRFSIHFASNGKLYTIQIDRASMFNGKLRTSQYISLIG